MVWGFVCLKCVGFADSRILGFEHFFFFSNYVFLNLDAQLVFALFWLWLVTILIFFNSVLETFWSLFGNVEEQVISPLLKFASLGFSSTHIFSLVADFFFQFCDYSRVGFLPPPHSNFVFIFCSDLSLMVKYLCAFLI